MRSLVGVKGLLLLSGIVLGDGASGAVTLSGVRELQHDSFLSFFF